MVGGQEDMIADIALDLISHQAPASNTTKAHSSAPSGT
jgi:DmpG-like communication domain